MLWAPSTLRIGTFLSLAAEARIAGAFVCVLLYPFTGAARLIVVVARPDLPASELTSGLTSDPGTEAITISSFRCPARALALRADRTESTSAAAAPSPPPSLRRFRRPSFVTPTSSPAASFQGLPLPHGAAPTHKVLAPRPRSLLAISTHERRRLRPSTQRQPRHLRHVTSPLRLPEASPLLREAGRRRMNQVSRVPCA